MTKNRHGTVYPYFVCLGRHQKRTDCTQPATEIALVEQLVIDEVHRRSLTPQRVRELKEFLSAELTVYLADFDQERDHQQLRITRLLDQRSKLLQAHFADAVTLEQLQEEQGSAAR